ncbi:MAG: hypothetical protein OXM58_12165 [Rhodospirillaceae bacterium]|nr:hypothetical protein [Rhodospirillaceae bacterium]MDE0616450.1 hypothetical protein [Rhodospirillaceae bacterium]
MTSKQSDRLAVLEVMVEMLTAQSMMMEADPDAALADYGEVAVMMLSRRRSEDEMDGLVPLLAERTAKVREHIEAVRRAQN